MSDYDYLNARVRGMSTLLLTREFYERVLQASSETAFADALLATPYAEDVQREMTARGGASDGHAVEAALSANVRAAFSKILAMAPAVIGEIDHWDGQVPLGAPENEALGLVAALYDGEPPSSGARPATAPQ